MRKPFFSALLLLAAAVPSAHTARSSSGDRDRSTVGSDITIPAGQTAGDIACVFCTVRIHGDGDGDVAILFGSLVLDPGQHIGGDVAILGGNLTLGEGAAVDGDLALAAGDLHLAPSASIRGSRSVLPGRLWLLIPLLPFLFLAGLIWLIVHFTRRRYVYPAYAPYPGQPGPYPQPGYTPPPTAPFPPENPPRS